MNIVDSSAWLEYFANGRNASEFAGPVANTTELIVPSITLYEVFKHILRQRDESAALQAIAAMRQGQVIDLDQSIALSAAKLSVSLKLPMAESVILASARQHNAILWTQDADFKGISGVRYYAKA